MYERATLILDDGGGAPLAGLSLSLISLGLSPLYATDLDELVLLSREYASRVGGLLVAAEAVPAQLDAVLSRLAAPLRLTPAALVPVGAPLPEAQQDELCRRGLRWALWRPFETTDLRFVVAKVLSETDPEEFRFDVRVPCSIPARVEAPTATEGVRVTDLSIGGCFASLPRPMAQNSRVTLRLDLDGEPTAIRGRVAWCTGPSTPEWRDSGMGIEYLEVEDAARPALERQIAGWVGRFRIGAERAR